MNRTPPSRLSSFLAELRERRVIQVAVVYAVVAFGVAQVADIVAPGLNLPEWSLTLVLFLLILGFPVALALAWVFDVGPGGLERTPRRSARSSSGLVRETDGASVAVLPFVNLSSDPEQEYFSDGLTEELLNVLAQVPGLRVPARTSSFAFKGKNTDIREIGEVLGVRTVLEGSVRTRERRVLITAQLINVEDGYHLWSDTYKRDLEDIFEVQEEIARSIVQTLKGRLLGEAETPQVKEATADPEAYQLYLKGRHFYNRFSTEDFRKARALFEQAVEKDPAFGRAWAGIAEAWERLAYLGAVPAAEALPQARAAAERALALEPQLPDGYLARSRIAHDTRDFAAAERDLRRALELSPGSGPAHNVNGIMLTDLCRHEEAVAAFRRALELDPLWTAPVNNLGIVHSMLGRLPEALAAYEQALELKPSSGPLAKNVADTLSRLGRHEEAIARMRELYARESDSRTAAGLAECLLRAGERVEAEVLLEELEHLRAQGKAGSLDLAGLYGELGRFDEAFAALEQALATDEPAVAQLAAEPGCDPLREDPRWEPLLARAGFPEDAIRRSRELYQRRKAAAAREVTSPDKVPPR